MEELIAIISDLLEEVRILNDKLDEIHEANQNTFGEMCEKLENVWGKLDSFEDTFIKYQ